MTKAESVDPGTIDLREPLEAAWRDVTNAFLNRFPGGTADRFQSEGGWPRVSMLLLTFPNGVVLMPTVAVSLRHIADGSEALDVSYGFVRALPSHWRLPAADSDGDLAAAAYIPDLVRGGYANYPQHREHLAAAIEDAGHELAVILLGCYFPILAEVWRGA